MSVDKDVVKFQEVGKGDIPLVGGKGANLGEMLRANIPVPPGFIVTADAYARFIEQSGLHGRDRGRPLRPRRARQRRPPAGFRARSKKLIIDTPVPADIAAEIKTHYHEMGERAGGRAQLGDGGGPAGGLVRRPAEHIPQRRRRGQSRGRR